MKTRYLKPALVMCCDPSRYAGLGIERYVEQGIRDGNEERVKELRDRYGAGGLTLGSYMCSAQEMHNLPQEPGKTWDIHDDVHKKFFFHIWKDLVETPLTKHRAYIEAGNHRGEILCEAYSQICFRVTGGRSVEELCICLSPSKLFAFSGSSRGQRHSLQKGKEPTCFFRRPMVL